MNKTIAVNIGGCVFNIEEDAYQQLKYYLEAIGKRFDTNEAREEILADVEARMAELFNEMLGDTREVITLKDVKLVIDTMGRPEAFDQDDQEEAEPSNSQTRNKERRMYRDTENAMLGGVAAGLGQYLGWDPVVLRIIFVLLAFFGLAGLPIYIILWLVIPEARTTAEKLRMRGSKIDLESISKKFSDGIDNVSETMKSKKTRDGADRLLSGLGAVFLLLGQLIRWFLGILALGLGILLAVVTIAALVSLIFETNVPTMLTSSFLKDYFFIHPFWYYLSFVGVLLCVLVPIFGLLYSGIRLLLNISTPIKGLSVTLIIAIVIGSLITITSAVFHTAEFSRNERVQEIIQLPTDSAATHLEITISEDPYWPKGVDPKYQEPLELLKVNNEELVIGKATLRFRATDRKDFGLEIMRRSSGRSVDDALEKAGAVVTRYEMNDNRLQLAPFFAAPASHKYRNQSLILTLHVPDSARLVLPDNIHRVLRYDHGLEYTTRREAGGKSFQNLGGKLECVSCPRSTDTPLSKTL